MQTNNTCPKAITAKDSLIMDILCGEFGCSTISQAIKDTNHCNIFKTEDFSLVLQHFNLLCYEWQSGNAKRYLESLSTELQHSIICHLMTDYINDKTSEKVEYATCDY